MSFKVNIVRSDKTALQIASHQGFTRVVEFLLQLGAKVNLQVSVIKFWPIIFNQPDWKIPKQSPWRWLHLGRELPTPGWRHCNISQYSTQRLKPFTVSSSEKKCQGNLPFTAFTNWYNYYILDVCGLLSKYWSSCLLSTGHWRWHCSSLRSIWVSVVQR